MTATFGLRLPFTSPIDITGLDATVELKAAGPRVQLSKAAGVYVLFASPFPTEDQARAFWPTLWAGLAWTAARTGTPFRTEAEFSDVAIAPDPEAAAVNLEKSFGFPNTGPVHGLVDGDHPSVLPLDMNIRFLHSGTPSVLLGRPAVALTPSFREALNAPQADRLFTDDRLRIAVELFSDSHLESSGRSRFLTLVMALEVLSTPSRKHQVAQDILDTLEAQLMAAIATHDNDSEEWASLDSLKRELWFRRESSLRSRIRALVLSSLAARPEAERRSSARDAVWAYDLRGTLVHEGTVTSADLGRGYDIALRTVTAVLEARMGIPASA